MRGARAVSRAACLLAAFAVSGIANASEVTVWDTFGAATTPGLTVGQPPMQAVRYRQAVRFVPTSSGYLRSFSFGAWMTQGTADFTFRLLADNSGSPGGVLETLPAVDVVGGTPVPYSAVSTQNTYLIANQAYWISASLPPANTGAWSPLQPSSGTGTHANCDESTGCGSYSIFINSTFAPGLEVRVETTSQPLKFDFNEPTCWGDDYEPLYCPVLFEQAYADGLVKVDAGGTPPPYATAQQNTRTGRIELLRNGPGPADASATMRIYNQVYYTGVPRFRLTVTNGHNQVLTVTPQIQLADQAGLAQTIAPNTTQTVCFPKSAVPPGYGYTAVTFSTTGYSTNWNPGDDLPPTISWDDLVVDPTGVGPDTCEPPTSFFGPTPSGLDVPVVQLDQFQMEAKEVIYSGYTNADFCIAPDPREVKVGATWRYTARTLRLSELANRGTCKGATSDPEFTWQQLLNATGLDVAPWYRAFIGKPKIGPAGVKDTEGPWIVVGIVRTSAEYNGAVGVYPLAEKLIDYGYNGQLSTKNELQCDTARAQRPLSLGGTVEAFGDFMNVEDERMIPETGQCDGGVGLTRRTTHIFPVRIDPAVYSDKSNAMTQLDGLSRTLDRARQCVIAGGSDANAIGAINEMRTALNAARTAVVQGLYPLAVDRLEDFAFIADADQDGDQFTLDFPGCDERANYKGAFVARSINAAFAVFDRLQYPGFNTPPDPDGDGLLWKIYFPPPDLDLPLIVKPPTE